MLRGLPPALKSRTSLRSRNLLTLIPKERGSKDKGLAGGIIHTVLQFTLPCFSYRKDWSYGSLLHRANTASKKTCEPEKTEQCSGLCVPESARSANSGEHHCALSVLGNSCPANHGEHTGIHAQLTVGNTHMHGAGVLRNTTWNTAALHMLGAEWCSARFAG